MTRCREAAPFSRSYLGLQYGKLRKWFLIALNQLMTMAISVVVCYSFIRNSPKCRNFSAYVGGTGIFSNKMKRVTDAKKV
jgi:hypothetical protein